MSDLTALVSRLCQQYLASESAVLQQAAAAYLLLEADKDVLLIPLLQEDPAIYFSSFREEMLPLFQVDADAVQKRVLLYSVAMDYLVDLKISHAAFGIIDTAEVEGQRNVALEHFRREGSFTPPPKQFTVYFPLDYPNKTLAGKSHSFPNNTPPYRPEILDVFYIAGFNKECLTHALLRAQEPSYEGKSQKLHLHHPHLLEHYVTAVLDHFVAEGVFSYDKMHGLYRWDHHP
ncbi:hypothetical protein HZB02_03680 [Candidatus Woesearchaeota archaeon]|nr:hypothetical protein [Candidatus Woesearchaeota archaeon]